LRKRKKEHEVEKMEKHLLLTKQKLARAEDSLASTEAKLTSTEFRFGSLEVIVHRLINTTIVLLMPLLNHRNGPVTWPG